jgi:FAD/FMN-containing dehydrogenase
LFFKPETETMADSTGPQFTYLLSLVSDSEIIHPSSDLYIAETSTWAAQKNLHPRLVLRPSSTECLSKVIEYLSTTDLDMTIRGSGYGSASAKDVLVSMAAFDDFEFDKEDEILTIGAGQLWRDYYEKMERVAPDYHGWSRSVPTAQETYI